jgi:hypothetical protein
MNGKCIIAIAIAFIFMSCSKSTTATSPEEQKMYVFADSGNADAGNELHFIEMSKDNHGVWQASLIVPQTTVSRAFNYYSILIAEKSEIEQGVAIYGDTLAVQTGSWLRSKPDTIAFPFAGKVLKKYIVGIVPPYILPTKVLRIPRPDTLFISFDPTDYSLSVQ